MIGANGDDDNGEDAGETHIFFGGTSISPEGDIILLGEPAEDEFGQCVASAAGLNQDDSSEVVIGAWRWNNSRGKIYVYGSSPSGNQVPALSMYGLGVLIILITASTVWLFKRNKTLTLTQNFLNRNSVIGD